MSQGCMISAYVAHDIFYNKGEEYATCCARKAAERCVKSITKAQRITPTVTLEALLCEENNEVHCSNDCSPAVMLDR